jgi:hypothetical protein
MPAVVAQSTSSVMSPTATAGGVRFGARGFFPSPTAAVGGGPITGDLITEDLATMPHTIHQGADLILPSATMGGVVVESVSLYPRSETDIVSDALVKGAFQQLPNAIPS